MRILTLLFLVAMISCGEESSKASVSSIDYTNVLGYWSIDAATRNGKVTSTLADSYVHFESLDKMSTNLLGIDMTQAIIWNDSTAMVSDSSMMYKLVSLNPDTLNLSFKIQRHSFDIRFVKGEGQ